MAKHEHTILIIDDNVPDTNMLKQILGNEYNICEERLGSRGVSTAKKIRPSLVLLDIIVPDMDGFDVITALKKDEETQGIPVIFITGLVNIRDEEHGLLLGAADFISKPFNSDIVKLRVKNQIQISSQIQMIHTLSTCDMLTGLKLRDSLTNIIDAEWRKAIKMDYSISFAIINVDNFRKYNIEHGYQKGDEVLQYVSRVITKNVRREDDRVGRWGDDEFAVFLPATDLEGVEQVAKNIYEAIERELCDIPAFTVSVGVHSVVPEPRSWYTSTDFVTDTIAALAFAKRNGKNQIALFTNVEGNGDDDAM